MVKKVKVGRLYMKCLKCGGRAYITDWEPLLGQDPTMRQFRCRGCHRLVYKLLDQEELYNVRIQKR